MTVPSSLPFSTSRVVGDTVYLSGEVGVDETGAISGDIAQQTQATLRRIEATLSEYGLDRADIFSCTCYLVRQEDFARFNEAYRAFFDHDPLPVRTTVLADLVIDALVEITVIAKMRA